MPPELPTRELPTRTLLWGTLVSILALVAVLSSLLRDPVDGDSFPLSTYPMFAARRPDAHLAMDYVIATGPAGARRHVPPELIGNAEPLQAMMTIQHAVRTSRAAVLCTEVAARVARDSRFAAMDHVAVVAANHDSVAYLTHGVHAAERENARCPIPGHEHPP